MQYTVHEYEIYCTTICSILYTNKQYTVHQYAVY